MLPLYIGIKSLLGLVKLLLLVSVSATSDITGSFPGFAHLTGLPDYYLGNSISSDNPSTFQVNDPTPITVVLLAIDIGEDITICSDTLFTIGLEGSSSLNDFVYLWNTSETTPTIFTDQARRNL